MSLAPRYTVPTPFAPARVTKFTQVQTRRQPLGQWTQLSSNQPGLLPFYITQPVICRGKCRLFQDARGVRSRLCVISPPMFISIAKQQGLCFHSSRRRTLKLNICLFRIHSCTWQVDSQLLQLLLCRPTRWINTRLAGRLLVIPDNNF